jgi:hypothetical protein
MKEQGKWVAVVREWIEMFHNECKELHWAADKGSPRECNPHQTNGRKLSRNDQTAMIVDDEFLE